MVAASVFTQSQLKEAVHDAILHDGSVSQAQRRSFYRRVRELRPPHRLLSTAVSDIVSPAHFDAAKTKAFSFEGSGHRSDLAVTNFFNPGYFDGVVVLNRNYKLIQTITDGTSNPNGAYYDSDGNLYVAISRRPQRHRIQQEGDADVHLFRPASATRVALPSTMATPLRERLGDDKASVVVEYAQGSKQAPRLVSAPAFANAAVATDRKGNVFVSVDVPNGIKRRLHP